MNGVDREYEVQAKAPNWLVGVAVAALLVALGGLAWSLSLQNRLAESERRLTASSSQNSSLADKLEDTNERMKAQGETLAQSVGLTQKQLEDKSAQLVGAQRQAASAAAAAGRVAKQQEATSKDLATVKDDVGNVKTDVATTKTDVASTQSDLAATKSQLTRVMGDQGVMSGLIATNHDELEELKRRGERNYYEFTLNKNQPTNVGTIKLTLKKVDTKKNKYNLFVDADDKNIEKKDKNLDEPVQFYSGKTPMLYELVVNNIGKNTVQGYLSVPKGAPMPIDVGK